MKIFKLVKSLILTGLFLIIFAGTASSINAWPRFGVVYRSAPVEVIFVRPGPRFVWIRGHYRTGFRRCAVWVPGHWKRI